MRVKGSLAEFQSSLNFYLVLCPVSEYRTVDELRKYYFDKFIKEDINQTKMLDAGIGGFENPFVDSFFDKNTEDGSLVEEPEVIEDTCLPDSGISEEESTKEVITPAMFLSQVFSPVESYDSEEEKEVEEVITPASFLSQVFSNNEEVEDAEEVVTPKSFLSQILGSSETEVVHGTYIEDISLSDCIEEPVIDKSFIDAPVKTSVVHGTYIEDIDIGQVEDTDINQIEDSQQGVSFEDIGGNEVETSAEEVIHGVYIEDIDLDDTQSKNKECVEYGTEEQSLFLDMGNTLTEDEEYDLENGNIVEESENTYVENENSIVEERKPIEISKNENLEERNIEAPADLREFLRKYPFSDIEFVAKYYPKKEIERQIMLGRVYKRKGKLMI